MIELLIICLILLGLTLCAIGQPLRTSIRAVLTSMTDGNEDNVTRLFTGLTLMDIFSGAVVTNILALSFTSGLHIGGGYLGAPFFTAAFLLLIITVVLFYSDNALQEQVQDVIPT